MSDPASSAVDRDEEMDPEIIREGTHEGLRYKVVQIPAGHYCGYVRSAFDDSWHYDDFQGWPYGLISIHGGVTYGVGADGWLGFDCAHAGDLCRTEDGEKLETYLPTEREFYAPDADSSTVWKPADVVEECQDLARQVAGIQEFAEKVVDRGY